MIKQILAALFLRSTDGYELIAFTALTIAIPSILLTATTGPEFTAGTLEWKIAMVLGAAAGATIYALNAAIIHRFTVKCMHFARYITGNKQITRRSHK